MVGFGIEFLIQFSPPPTPSAIGKMMPQGGFGDFLFSIALNNCRADLQFGASKKQGGNESPKLVLTSPQFFFNLDPI